MSKNNFRIEVTLVRPVGAQIQQDASTNLDSDTSQQYTVLPRSLSLSGVIEYTISLKVYKPDNGINASPVALMQNR